MIYEVGVVRNGQTDMLCYNRNTPEQAIRMGNRHGRVIFCRKVKRDKVLAIGSIEHMRLTPSITQVKKSPYKSAIAMDEFIGQKRNLRRANLYKDKNNA